MEFVKVARRIGVPFVPGDDLAITVDIDACLEKARVTIALVSAVDANPGRDGVAVTAIVNGRNLDDTDDFVDAGAGLIGACPVVGVFGTSAGSQIGRDANVILGSGEWPGRGNGTAEETQQVNVLHDDTLCNRDSNDGDSNLNKTRNGIQHVYSKCRLHSPFVT